MAPKNPLRKSLPSSSNKENDFLRNVSDFQSKVRRRESLRSLRQVNKELDLEQKIEVEIKMREGTTKLLQACKHQSQSLEAAKSLLTSNERMTAYMAELQRRKRPSSYNGTLTLPNNKMSGGSRARVCLSDLRMPLIWRDTDHFKNKGDYRRFAVFCLAKIGTEMYDTSLLCPVDRSLTDLTFPDVLVFNQVPADFSCTLEVYSHMLREDMSMASTRRKIKNTIHTSISRTVGKKLAASLRDELNSGKIGPHFELMASARLTLDDVNDGVRTHDLKLEHSDVRSNGDCLPLFGHFCCRLAAEPECLVKEITSGPVFDLVGDGDKDTTLDSEMRGASWASLQGFNLNFWRDRKHWLQDSLRPLHSVPINRDTIIKCSKNCDNIIVVNENEGKETTTTFKLKNTDEREQWVRFLAEHAKDHNRWKIAAEKAMEIYTPGSGKQNFGRQTRQGSLYDETPLIESVQPPDYVNSSQRPRVQDIFGLTPSTSLSSCSSSSSPPPPVSGFRERSLSSGTKSRARWPFLK